MSKIAWLPLTDSGQLMGIAETSRPAPCIIFKHSTRCPLSSMVKSRLENSWDISKEGLDAYFLDLIAYRGLSNTIATAFGVRHESPQVLLIQNGRCTYHASHQGIRVQDIKNILSINV